MIQLIVFIDDELFCDGVKLTFKNNPDIRVTGEAANVQDFFRLLAACTPVNFVLMGVNYPGEHRCVDVTKHIRHEYPTVKILAVANRGTAGMIQSMMKTGINGYIGRRQTNRKELEKAIRKVAEGGEYIGKIEV